MAKQSENDNIATWAVWTFIISTVVVIIACIVCLILFSVHYAQYNWKEIGEIEYLRSADPNIAGKYISQMNTVAGWYKLIDENNNCNNINDPTDCDTKYEMWDGYTEDDLNKISIGKAVIFGILSIYSIIFLVIACMYYECDYFIVILIIYIIVTCVIELCLTIFEWCQVDRYYKKYSNESDSTTESYTPYKFINDISEGFSNVKKMLRRY